MNEKLKAIQKINAVFWQAKREAGFDLQLQNTLAIAHLAALRKPDEVLKMLPKNVALDATDWRGWVDAILAMLRLIPSLAPIVAIIELVFNLLWPAAEVA